MSRYYEKFTTASAKVKNVSCNIEQCAIDACINMVHTRHKSCVFDV